MDPGFLAHDVFSLLSNTSYMPGTALSPLGEGAPGKWLHYRFQSQTGLGSNPGFLFWAVRLQKTFLISLVFHILNCKMRIPLPVSKRFDTDVMFSAQKWETESSRQAGTRPIVFTVNTCLHGVCVPSSALPRHPRCAFHLPRSTAWLTPSPLRGQGGVALSSTPVSAN